MDSITDAYIKFMASLGQGGFENRNASMFSDSQASGESGQYKIMVIDIFSETA
jgi:hypothetical protein